MIEGGAATAKEDADASPSPRTVLGLLAGEDRRKVVSALILGSTTVSEIESSTQLSNAIVIKALERLVGGGLVERTPPSPTAKGGGLRLCSNVFEQAARDSAQLRRAVTPEDMGATPSQASGMRNWLTEDGRLKSVPMQRIRRMPILDFLAGKFEPGKTYPEARVNLILGEFHSDTAALRRYLVDEEFLERRDGFYWRAGGTFVVEPDQ
jgi:hypothetical protein